MGSELTSTPSHPQKRRLAAPLAATAGLSHQITAPGGQEAAALAPDLPLRMPSVCGIQCWSGTQGSESDFRRLGTFREAGPAARPPPCQHQESGGRVHLEKSASRDAVACPGPAPLSTAGVGGRSRLPPRAPRPRDAQAEPQRPPPHPRGPTGYAPGTPSPCSLTGPAALFGLFM